MAAVVDHAGAGTTGAGLRAGVPSVTVPMLGDQPFWAARLAVLGVGPGLPPPAAFRPAARRGRQRRGYPPVLPDQARAMSGRLADEDGAAPVISALARLNGRPA